MKRQNLIAYLYKKNNLINMHKRKILLLIGIILLFSTPNFAEDWMQLYPEINGPVADMEFSEIPGISEYGLIFALWSSGGGLGYFDDTGQFNIYNSMLYEYMISISADNSNNRIFCAIFTAAIVPNLVKFDVYTHQFEVVESVIGSWFVKKLHSGFYYGYGNGLLFSETGDVWENIDFFNLKNVRDIEELSDGTFFVAADNKIYISNDSSFSPYDSNLYISDIYIQEDTKEEVFISVFDSGSYSDGVYRVEYENGEITGIILINWISSPYKIYKYEDLMVVGCLNSFGLWLIEPQEMGVIYQIGTELDFEDVYCFETYPIYTPNIMVGTDNGVYFGTCLDIEPNCELITFVVQCMNNILILYWVTQSETDNFGWNIYRSINDSSFVHSEVINDTIIPGYGTTTEPHFYIYEDTDLVINPGDVIFYWLESIDFGGNTYIYDPAYQIIPSGVDEWHLHSKDIVLSQNYPNPFSGSTTILFNLATKLHENTQIKIYNVKGQMVRQLSIVNNQFSIVWDGKDENGNLVNSGLYFYQLKIGDKLIDTKKSLLMR